MKRALSSAYISPESTRGLSPDVRADIYSSGVILYEMLTGNLEYLGSTRVIDIVEDVPDWLDEIVIRCIRKVREDRYQSIDDIFTDLKALSKSKKSRIQNPNNNITCGRDRRYLFCCHSRLSGILQKDSGHSSFAVMLRRMEARMTE